MQYLLLIHGNAQSSIAPEQWSAFFAAANASGLFRGGSQLGTRTLLGSRLDAGSTDHIVGYMRFDSDDKQALLDLLKTHPVVVQGGTVELCELPES